MACHLLLCSYYNQINQNVQYDRLNLVIAVLLYHRLKALKALKAEEFVISISLLDDFLQLFDILFVFFTSIFCANGPSPSVEPSELVELVNFLGFVHDNSTLAVFYPSQYSENISGRRISHSYSTISYCGKRIAYSSLTATIAAYDCNRVVLNLSWK
jgi:hypothetical protein